MGNEAKSKIVVLREKNSQFNFSYTALSQSNIDIVFYDDWNRFTQNQAIEQIQNIIVAYKVPEDKKKPHLHPQKQQQNAVKINPFAQICPFLSPQSRTGSMKDRLISHVKKYSININIYLYVDRVDGVELLHYEKPYIKLVSNNLEYIKNSFLNAGQNLHKEKENKSKRMFEGMYRRMVVKVLDEFYQPNDEKKKDDGKGGKQEVKIKKGKKQDFKELLSKIEKEKLKNDDGPIRNPEIQRERLKREAKQFQKFNIEPQYFNSIQKFQRSFISTTCEYVICSEKDLLDVIDCKKKCQQEYRIILKLQQKHESQDQESVEEKKQQKQQQREVWARHQKLEEILSKIINFTEISREEAPFISRNIIICGDDPLFLSLLDQEEKKNQIRKAILAKFSNQKHKEGKKSSLNQSQPEISFIKGGDLQKSFLSQIQKTIYSYVVVFCQSQLLETIKKFLRVRNFNQRVQLTYVPDQAPTYNSVSESQKQRRLKQKISYLQEKVPYLIKFQVGPIVSIHLYKPSENLFSFFNEKIGLKAAKITSKKQFLSNYIGSAENSKPSFSKFIESKRLVVNIEDYSSQIQPLQKSINDLGIKIIIFDEDRKKIENFVKNPDRNYIASIEYVDFDKLRVQNFVLKCKASNVSIPFFRPSVLFDFESQSKAFLEYKSSYTIPLESSVMSSNETILNMLGENYLGLNTQYSMGLIAFSSKEQECPRDILKFQQNYITSYVKLWYLGMDIIKEPKNQRNGLKTFHIQLSLLKEQICYLFYKCKSYDLLNVSEDDFKQFYIQRVEECNDFLDLQIACVYILSLPHGFSNVISDVFKNKQKSKLAVKIFAVYMIVLMTAYYDFAYQEEQTIKILAYLNKDIKLNKEIDKLKQGDTVFTNDFVFCVDTKKENINMDRVNSHLITFKFDSIRVLEKSKIKSYINIQKCSFYKEGPEYVIPPFTKFQISKITRHLNGTLQLQLQDVTNRLKSLPYRILNQNELPEELIFKIYDSEIIERKSSVTKITQKSLSLYKRTEKVNVLKNKEQVVQQFKKGKNYNLFFQTKNTEKYLTAFVHLASQMKTIEALQDKGDVNAAKNREKENLLQFGVQVAYLYYHLNEYPKSIEKMRKIKEVMEEEGQINQRQQWKKKTVAKICENVEATFEKRVTEILQYPRRKFWKVSFQQNYPITDPKKANIFKLKRRSEKWQSSYREDMEIFPLSYKGCQYSNQQKGPEKGNQRANFQMKKMLEEKDLIPEVLPNEFGCPTINEIESRPFGYLSEGKKLKNTNPELQQQSSQSDSQKLKQNQKIVDEFQQFLPVKKDRTEQWVVFYVGNDIKLTTRKKKHYRLNLTNCKHEHAEKKIKRFAQQKKVVDRFRVRNTSDEGFKYFVPNDEAPNVPDRFFVPNIAVTD